MLEEKISEERVVELGDSIGYFKVNLPNTKESYHSGNGEGVWAVVEDKDIYDKYNNNELKNPFYVFIANDSIYYPYLICGSRVLVEPKGDKRPVAVWDKLTQT